MLALPRRRTYFGGRVHDAVDCRNVRIDCGFLIPKLYSSKMSSTSTIVVNVPPASRADLSVAAASLNAAWVRIRRSAWRPSGLDQLDGVLSEREVCAGVRTRSLEKTTTVLGVADGGVVKVALNPPPEAATATSSQRGANGSVTSRARIALSV